MQTLFQNNFRRINIQHANFGGKDHITVIRHIIAGGAQTVAVQNGTHNIAVSKQDRSRAVPRFHHGSVVLVEIPFLLIHHIIVRPWLRNSDHHRQRQVHAAHGKKFQSIIQHGRVGTFRIDHRKDLMQFPFKIVGSHGLFPGQHLIRISTDGIDLAVMYHKAVGMRPLPAGIGVGAKSGVHQGNGGIIVRVLQIHKEGTELSHQEHSFINNGTAGHGDHIGSVVRLLKTSAGHIQPPIKGQALFYILRFLNKRLHNAGHLFQCFVSQHCWICGNLSPAKELQAFFFHDALKHLFRLTLLKYVLGKEKHTDTVLPLLT